MARPTGTRNPGYDDKRRSLARAAMEPIFDLGGLPLSLRQTARAAGVSVPTMRHYFGDLDGVIAAAFELIEEDGEVYRRRAAGQEVAQAVGTADAVREGSEPIELDPFPVSVRWLVDYVRKGWGAGLDVLHAAGLARGLESRERGEAYVQSLLEPMLQAAEARLRLHIERGEMIAGDVRFAALSLMSPVLLALLHQEGLAGNRCRPMNITAFIEAHVAGFVRGYAAPAKKPG
jgi:AcrR family transcriptional regulator